LIAIATNGSVSHQRQGRLARDFERYATTVTAFVPIAMIRIMLKRRAANISS